MLQGGWLQKGVALDATLDCKRNPMSMSIHRIVDRAHMKYSNASSLLFRMSCKSSAIKTRLVGSMLYCISTALSSNHE